MFLWLVIALVLVSVFSNMSPHHGVTEKVSYSQFLKDIKQDSIQSIMVEEDKVIRGTTKNNQTFVTYMPLPDFALLDELIKHNVDVNGQEKQQESFLMHIFEITENIKRRLTIII